MIVKLLTEHHLESLSLKGSCRGSSKSNLVKMSNCWKSHAMAHFCFYLQNGNVRFTNVGQNIPGQKSHAIFCHPGQNIPHRFATPDKTSHAVFVTPDKTSHAIFAALDKTSHATSATQDKTSHTLFKAYESA